jgi:hypothetical protein
MRWIPSQLLKVYAGQLDDMKASKRLKGGGILVLPRGLLEDLWKVLRVCIVAERPWFGYGGGRIRIGEDNSRR